MYLFIAKVCPGGGFIFFYFHPYLGKWSNLTNIFQLGWNHQLVCGVFYVFCWAVWNVGMVYLILNLALEFECFCQVFELVGRGFQTFGEADQFWSSYVWKCVGTNHLLKLVHHHPSKNMLLETWSAKWRSCDSHPKIPEDDGVPSRRRAYKQTCKSWIHDFEDGMIPSEIGMLFVHMDVS